MNRFADILRNRLLLCLPLAAVVADNAFGATVSVYPDKVGQTVGGIGGGIVYYQDWLTNHPNREAVYDTLFNGLGISCLRMGNWAVEDNADDNLIASNDAIIYKAAKEYCGDKLPVLMTSWSAPAYLKANNSRHGSNNWAKGTLKKENGQFVYDKYGQWWAESLGRYHKLGVFPDFISIQNEPDCDQPDYDCMVLNPTETYDVAGYGKALSAVSAQVRKMPNAPKMIGADNIGIGWNQTQDYVNNLDRKLLDGYSFHYYHSGKNDHSDRYSYPNDFIESMKGLANDLKDKPMFMTENSALRESVPMDAVYTAWFIANAFNINRVQYYFHWNLIWGDGGETCINLQKWDSTYKQPWNGGFRTQPAYHGLRHFSKFVRPGMQLIDTWASTNQMTTCGFKAADGSAYTLIFINQGNTEQTVSHDLPVDDVNFDSRVVLTAADKDIYSQDLGAYQGSVTMPAHSVVTIVYEKAHANVSPYVFKFDPATNNGHWTNPANWNTGCKPWPTDSLVLFDGECKLSKFNHKAPIVVLNSALFSLFGDVSVDSTIHMHGGALKLHTDSTSYALRGSGISVEQPSTIIVADKGSSLYLYDELYGSASLNKVGGGIIDLYTTNRDYSGTWYVRDGIIVANAVDALGSGNVEVPGAGLLQVNFPCALTNLRLEHDSTLLLNDTLSVVNAYFDEMTIPNGKYTKEDFPNYIMGDGVLVVEHPYPVLFKQDGGDSVQVVGIDSAIVSISYTWENAETVDVDWNPHQPDGINVEIAEWNKTVSFDGKPTEVGEFVYHIATVSIEDSIFVKTGMIKVLDSLVSHTSVRLAAVTGLTAKVVPASVNCGETAHLLLTAPAAARARVAILSASGLKMAEFDADIVGGANRVVLPLSGLSAGVYLVKVCVADEVQVLKVQIK